MVAKAGGGSSEKGSVLWIIGVEGIADEKGCEGN